MAHLKEQFLSEEYMFDNRAKSIDLQKKVFSKPVSTGAAQVEGFRAAPVRYPEYREPGGLARRLSGWSPLVLALIALLLLLIVPPFYFLLKTSLYTTNADGSFGDFTFDYLP